VDTSISLRPTRPGEERRHYHEQARVDRRVAGFVVVRNAQPIARGPGRYARRLCLIELKGSSEMKTARLTERNPARRRRWFQRRRRAHDAMLVFNMSIFNAGGSWERIFNPIPQRENVWA
jgi:hypothetical protein